MGSSPLARGTHGATPYKYSTRGLIPARAGNTPPGRSQPEIVRAHPRSRGEHCAASLGCWWPGGSSPLARGTPDTRRNQLTGKGLIPARAGNTGGMCRMVRGVRAHPRSRGEHLLMCQVTCFTEGSSPLARGTPDAETPVDAAAGLIPARAGNTLPRSAR